MACVVKAYCRVECVCSHLLFCHHLLDSASPKTVGRTRTLHVSGRSIATGNVSIPLRRCPAESVLQIAADVVRFCLAGHIARLERIELVLPSLSEAAPRFFDRPILHRKTAICAGVVAHGTPVYLSLDRRHRLSAHPRNLV